MSNFVQFPFEYMPNPVNGRPLVNASIYVGIANLDPQIPANQIPLTVVQCCGLETLVAQPIYTNAAGLPEYNGSPVQLKVAGPCSFKIVNNLGNQLYYFAEYNPEVDTLRTELAASGGSNLVGYGSRTLTSRLNDHISVMRSGITVDGTTDNSAGIIAADAYAASLGKSLFFPAGTYRGTGLTPTCSWYGEKGTVIKNTTSADIYSFISCDGQSDLEFECITFDGNVSADPGTWNSGNYNSFTGAIAFFVYNSSDITFRKCIFQNSVNSPLRVENSTRIVANKCYATKGRGTFGDGIYLRNCTFSGVVNSRIYDYTRIGIVTENGSHSCYFENNVCEYGHDGSLLYGGAEYNAGYWYENSGNHVTINCQAINNVHRGFLGYTGSIPTLPTDVAYYSYIACTSIDSNIGFVAASLGVGTPPVEAKLSHCRSYGAEQGFNMIAGLESDNFVLESCHAEIDFTVGGTNASGYFYGSTTFTDLPSFSFINCTTSYKNINQSDLDNTAYNAADVSCFAGGSARIHINNMRNLDAQYPIYFKGRTGDAELTIENTYIKIPTFSNVDYPLNIKSCKIAYAVVGGTSKCNVIDSDVVGLLQIGCLGEINIDNCDVKPGTSYLFVSRTLDSKRPALYIRNSRFEKDIATNGYVVRIQEEGTNKPNFFIQDCTFYNTGAATALKEFVYIVRSGTGANYSGVYSDSNVTYLQKINASLGNPATGDTKLTLH